MADTVYDLWAARAHASPDAPAIIDDARDTWVSHGELLAMADGKAEIFAANTTSSLVFIMTGSRVETVAAWMGAWKAGATVALVAAGMKPEMLLGLLEAYQPDFLVGPSSDVQTVLREGAGFAPQNSDSDIWTSSGSNIHDKVALHPELALLLFTSGTTGSPKAVRLTRSALSTNTKDIITSLSLDDNEVALGHLALNYSYGMSVANSHLVSGGAIVLTGGSLAQGPTWERAAQLGVTTVPLVPAQMTLMHKLKLDLTKLLPGLRSLTQAGGKVEPDIMRHSAEAMRRTGGRMYVMYGQTEACPRIACHDLAEPDAPADAAGRALASGKLEIIDDAGQVLPEGHPGFVRYTGPNVMWGYATGRDDLSQGDTMNGVLDTGDLGYLDDTGLLFITGRSSRFAKLGGIRCNLDELERAAAKQASPAAVVAGRDWVTIFWEDGALEKPARHAAMMARDMGLPRDSMRGRSVAAMPLLESGKVDYRTLSQMVDDDV